MLTNNHDVTAYGDMEKRLKEISAAHMKVAYRAHMSNYEILLCQEISLIGKFPLIDVMEKMASFKQTSEHLLYKKDFIFI